MKDSLQHISVLKNEVLEYVIHKDTKTVFDGTLGLGGHALSILEAYPNITEYVATDLDKQHLTFAKNRLKDYEQKTKLHLGNFATISQHISDKNQRPLSILLDLGLCSNQLDQADKGFSFSADGPLKMAFSGEKSADFFINNASEKEITKALYEYGEIKHAPKIAQKICKTREENPIKTTFQLRDIINAVTHAEKQRKTLTTAFQAIRIQVNDELTVLKTTLSDLLELMKSGDTAGIITYHSLEDRIVKKAFKTASTPITTSDNFSLHSIVKEAEFVLSPKKPIIPSEQEITENPRARSAKLRIIQKR